MRQISFLPFLLRLTLTLTIPLSYFSCSDDFEETLVTDEGSNSTSRSTQHSNIDNTNLVLLDNGHWLAKKRVPLTGVGRVLGNIAPGTVTVAAGSSEMNYIIDNDLTNAAKFGGLAKVDVAFNQFVSVRDMYRTYEGGQKVGFVYRMEGKAVLGVDVLKLFTISLYNDGKLLKTFNVAGEGGTLNLNLINVSTATGQGQQTVELLVPDGMAFDEVALGYGGVDISALKEMNILYAFVGETPRRTTVSDGAFDPNYYSKTSIYKKTGWTNWIDADKMLDADPNNGPWVDPLSGLLNGLGGGCRVTVDLGETVPAGSEVGVVYTAGDVLNLGVGSNVMLETYDTNKIKQESYAVGDVLGVSLIGGGKAAYSFLTTKDFESVYLRILGLNVKLGVTTYHYFYTLEKTAIDETSFFNFPEKDTITTNAYQFYFPKEGKITLELVEKPSGSSAGIAVDGLRVSGMNEVGDYVVDVTYQNGDKTFVQRTTVHKKEPEAAPASCSQLITKDNAHFYKPSEGGLLQIYNNSQHQENLLDNSYNTAMTYIGALNVAYNQSIVAIELNDNNTITVDPKGYSVGFIVQANSEFLSLNLLNYLYVKLIDDAGKEINRIVSGSRPSVDLGLLNGSREKIRIGVTVPAGSPKFKRIELYNAGVAAINLSSMRLYGVFYEPKNEKCAAKSVAEVCMETVTPASYGARFNYSHTRTRGLVGVANGLYSLDNIIDGNKETMAVLPITSVLGETEVAVQFNEMPANKTIGVIIRNPKYVADVKLIEGLSFRAYHRGREVAKYDVDNQFLNVGLLGHDDKCYLDMQPTQPFDEIRVSGKAVANVLDQLEIYEVYTRRDVNNDGIPECDDEVVTNLEPTGSGVRICHQASDRMNIPVLGSADNYEIIFHKCEDERFTNKKFYRKFTGLQVVNGNLELGTGLDFEPGVYLVDFIPDQTAERQKKLQFCNYPVIVHPVETTWKGNSDPQYATAWNHWGNWTAGIPWGCTNVVIPAGCTSYPVLTAGEDYRCGKIQFAAGTPHPDGSLNTGELIGAQHLLYDEAWADARLKAGEHYLLSTPLKGTYTGDVIPTTTLADYQDYKQAWMNFDGEETTALPSDFRCAPRVYQYKYGGAIHNQTNNGMEQLQPNEDHWTHAFNLVAEPYVPGQAFLMKIGENAASGAGSETLYELRWPKRYAEYDYYTPDGTLIPGRKETVNRENTGRFAFEDQYGTIKFPLRLSLVNERPGDTYLVGNPFMAHLNMSLFFEANVGVGSVTVMRNNVYTTYTKEKAEQAHLQVAPFEGFIMTLKSPYSDLNRYRYFAVFTDKMLEFLNQ